MNRKEKLQQLVIERFEGNQASFARAIARAPAQVSHWLTGHRTLGDAGARHIEISLGLGIGYFDSNAGSPKPIAPIKSDVFTDSQDDFFQQALDPITQIDDLNAVPQSSHGFSRIDLPIINIVEWGTLDETLGSAMFKNRNDVDGKPRIFGLKIQDDTNEPRLLQGSIAEINMDREPKHGDFVLARCDKDGPPTIKQLVIDGDRTFLKPFNQRYPIITPANLEILGVVQRKIEIEDF